MNSQQRKMIEEVRAVMQYHQILGIDGYPHTSALLGLSVSKVRNPVTEERTLPPPEKRVEPAVVVPASLADITARIHACRNCELHASRSAAVAGRGGERARLFIVGGWLTHPEQAAPASSMLFGLEEDRMVERMLAAIHLDPDAVFVTNILKCVLPQTCQPLAPHIQCCLAYLRQQIAVVAPTVICTMGSIATRALLDLPQSLSQLRGRFHLYCSLDGRQIPVMPTYHPSYLLQAEEMKKDTWEDLQLIEKRLAG